jgi:hypothetical protein
MSGPVKANEGNSDSNQHGIEPAHASPRPWIVPIAYELKARSAELQPGVSGDGEGVSS